MPNKFQELSVTVQIMILKMMSVKVLIILSTLSEKMRKVIEFGNIRVRDAVVEMSDENPYIAVSNHEVTDIVKFRLLSHEHYMRDPDVPSREQVIDGVRLKWPVESSNCFLSAVDETPESEIWERIFKYLHSLFRLKKYDVSISQYPLADGFLWKYEKNLVNLFVCVQEPDLNGDDLEFLFDELTVKNMTIQSAVSQDVEYKKPLTNQLVIAHNSKWLKFRAVFFSSASQIWLPNTTRTFSGSEMNSLLKYWVGGGLPNLQHLEIKTAYRPTLGYSVGFKDRTLSEIETRPWDGQRRPECYCCINLTRGLDLVNDNGKLATVLIKRNHFVFIVWPEDVVNPVCTRNT